MSNTDKLNRLLANIIEFNSGERLTADKLNALVNILDENLSHISGAIGDIYDENYDPAHRSESGKQFTSNAEVGGAQKRRFDIANLARLIGPASNLNPQAVGFASITETIPLGTLEYTLKHTILGAGSIPGYTYSINDFFSETEYKIIDDRKILFSKPLSEEKVITYITAPHSKNGGPNYQGARFNVYPDPNQINEKLTIQYAASTNEGNSPTYTITLPTIAHQQISLADGITSELDNRDINHNQQLLLPEWICDLGPNTVLPSYSLYLKNYDTNESYVDAVYTKVDNQKILVTNLNIGDQDCVDGFDLRIVTVGTDITTSIDDLRNKMYLHIHDGSFGEPPVHIKTLAGIFEGDAPSGVYGPATEDWNPLPNYLHRDGWRTTNGDVNGDNAMRGNLLMGLTSFDPISSKSISDTSSTSYGVFFGSSNTGIARYNSDLNIYNSNSTIVTATTINNIASAVTINTDSFVVEVNVANNQLKLLSEKTLNDLPYNSESTEIDSEEDLTTTVVKTTRRKIVRNNIASIINNQTGTPLEFPAEVFAEYQDNSYIDAYNILEIFDDEPFNLINSVVVDGKTLYVKNDAGSWSNYPEDSKLIDLFWSNENTNAIIKSMYVSERMFRLFVSSTELNCIYNFDLNAVYGQPGDQRIYSFAYRISQNNRDYRKFDLHIDRATPLLLNYDNIDPDYIYEHEYVVDINLLSIGGANVIWADASGDSSIEINNSSPFVVLNYLHKQSVDNELMLASEARVYTADYNVEDYSLPHNINNIYVSCPNLDTVVHVDADDEEKRTNLGEDMVHVFEGSIYIRVGRDFYATNVDSDGNPIGYGALEFDKLYIKERICNNDLFVEITGHHKGRVNGNDINFGRWKTFELPTN